MSMLSEKVRGKVADERCIVKRCRKEGCRVSLEKAPTPRILLDLDRPGVPFLLPDDTRCDYLFVGGPGESEEARVAPMELKKGEIKAADIVSQLRAGANLAERLIPAEASPKFVPVAVHGRGMARYQADILRRSGSHILFRGEKYAVKIIKCGARLVDALR